MTQKLFKALERNRWPLLVETSTRDESQKFLCPLTSDSDWKYTASKVNDLGSQ